jgi:hypothetical protein
VRDNKRQSTGRAPHHQQQALQEHIQAIAKMLYEDTPHEQLTSLAGIEQAVRSHMQRHVMPAVGVFLSKIPQAQAPATAGGSKASSKNSRSPVDKRKS